MSALSILTVMVLQGGGKVGNLASYTRKHFWLSQLGRGYWYPVGTQLRCCYTSYNTQTAPPTIKNDLAKNTNDAEMTNPALVGFRWWSQCLKHTCTVQLNPRNSAPKTILIDRSNWLDERKTVVWVRLADSACVVVSSLFWEKDLLC